MNFKKISKPLILVALIIVLCSILVRIFSGSETLAEYAQNNPESLPAETDGTKETETAKTTKAPQADNTNTDHSSAEKEDLSSTGQADDSINRNSDNDENAAEEPADKSEGLNEESEDFEVNTNTDRIEYKEGFYYEPLSDEIKKRITGISYPVTEAGKNDLAVEAVNIVSSSDEIKVDYNDLRYVSVLYYNFKGIVRNGDLICNKAIAQDLLEIFYELYLNEYQIESIHLIDEYGGDDTLSMQDNNTSCFNYRVVDGTSSLSKHALGLAIDINPFFNPYVVYNNDSTTYISPKGSETYADRSKDFAYKIDENDLCYKLFREHGFTWGGDWNSCKDYQHFQKVPK